MANTVILSAGEFRAFGEDRSLFGYKITDNDGNVYCQFNDFSQKTFCDSFPTPAHLWADALSHETFESLDYQYTSAGNLVMNEDDASIPAGDDEYILLGFDW